MSVPISPTIVFIEPRHAEAMQRLVSEFAVAKWTRLPHPYPDGGAVEFIRHQEEERAVGKSYVFAIEDRETFVGVCGLHGIRNAMVEEMGYWIGEPYWGHGLASGAVKLTLDFAFLNLRARCIHAHALVTNAPSRRVLEKNGFRLIEVAVCDEQGSRHHGQSIARYEILHEYWLESVG